MSTKYYTGIKFHSKSSEFKSKLTSSATEALKIAALGARSNYHSVTLYVQNGEKSIGFPYSEVSHLVDRKNPESDLAKLLEKTNP